MKHLSALNKYLWKYKFRLLFGICFVILSNYFRVLTPQVSAYVIDRVDRAILVHNGQKNLVSVRTAHYDASVKLLIKFVESFHRSFLQNIILCGILLFLLAIISGFFMFLMRQTIIVMSRLIEYDQKNEIFKHYEALSMHFFKTHNTGDLMNRITEDVSRVRMYTGPAIMYIANLVTTIGFCLFFMFREDVRLTLYVLSPLPLLSILIYYINRIIHKKSERIQRLLSELTSMAQESFSGIRVIKSFVQQRTMEKYFKEKNDSYRNSSIDLALVEAIYSPAMVLMIGLSTVLSVSIGCYYLVSQRYGITAGVITEFVIYINMLTFPVSAIGWTASIIQRASASQMRINEFLDTPAAFSTDTVGYGSSDQSAIASGDIIFDHLSFTYPHTGIKALRDVSFNIPKGSRVLFLGKTGSGKSTIAQLLLRFYDPTKGIISIGNKNIVTVDPFSLRQDISYVPQDVFLFSDSIRQNIAFAHPEASSMLVEDAARISAVEDDIKEFSGGYETVIGERGVMLSGGQKQRISIARAVMKSSSLVIFDDSLSAVDARTEGRILSGLEPYLGKRTTMIISHRIFTSFRFDRIYVLQDGEITEEGTHEALIEAGGYYAELYRFQSSGGSEGFESEV